MKNKLDYETAALEIVLLETVDLLTTSNLFDDDGVEDTDDGGWTKT